MEEKIIVINIRGSILKHPRWKRSEKAVRLLKEKIERIAKTDKVKIDQSLNELIWKRGNRKPPMKLRVKLVKEGEIYKALPA